jgi:hypothetical protein
MVLFFTSTEGYVMYMGADKYENEDLIKYGLPEDLWFHVDDMSSAHVYLRLQKNQRLEDVSPQTIMECAQLVKANSIEGCKMREVKVSKYTIQVQYTGETRHVRAYLRYLVVYTRWRNLKKKHDMDVGAIGFHDATKVKNLWVVKDKEIVKKIDKTKEVLRTMHPCRILSYLAKHTCYRRGFQTWRSCSRSARASSGRT